MIVLESSYRGFKTTISKLKNSMEESGNTTPVIIVFESDDLIHEYDIDSIPSIEATKQIFEGAKKITGYVYLGERLKHKQILFKEEEIAVKSSSSNANLGSDFNPILEQMKSILTASQEIQDIKNQALVSFYKEQDNSRATMYKDRENMFLELKTQEMNLKIKEIEATNKRRSDVTESLLIGLGSGFKELVGWVKENPGDFAEIVASLRAKAVN